jgi:hypothetical protein
MGPNRFLRHFAGDVSAPGVTAQVSKGWYDLSVAISGDDSWSRRYSGHLEDGKASITG